MEGVQLSLAEMGEDMARNSRNTVKSGWLDVRRRMQKQRKVNSQAGGELWQMKRFLHRPI
jgi:hypothetical protein